MRNGKLSEFPPGVQVLVALKEHGHHTLMCGDGANDVGALKQAHVGIALLSGFGSANVDKDGDGSDSAAPPQSRDERRHQREALAAQKVRDALANAARLKAEHAQKVRECAGMGGRKLKYTLCRLLKLSMHAAM